MGYGGPLVGALLVCGGMGFLAIIVLTSAPLKPWRQEAAPRRRKQVYAVVSALAVVGPGMLYAFAPNRTEALEPQSDVEPARPKYRGTATIETTAGPENDVMREQFDLDGAGTLLLQPPFDESQVTLAWSIARQTSESGMVSKDAAVVRNPQTIRLGGPPATFTIQERTFGVALESADFVDRTPERYRRFRFLFRITER
jgi:hypothetical protein